MVYNNVFLVVVISRCTLPDLDEPVTCLVWREVRIVWVAALIRRVIRVVGDIVVWWVVWIVWVWWIIRIIWIIWIWWIIWIVWVWWIIGIIWKVGNRWIVWIVWIIRVVGKFGIGWIIRVVGKSYPIVSLVLAPRLVLLSIPPFPHNPRVPHDLFRCPINTAKENTEVQSLLTLSVWTTFVPSGLSGTRMFVT